MGQEDESGMEHRHPRELAPTPQGVARGGLTVRRGDTEEPPDAEDGRPAYERTAPDGTPIMSRAEVAAKLESEQGENMATLSLYNEQGELRRSMRIDKKFATKFVEFDGRRYERTEEGSSQYQDVGEAQGLKTQQ